MTVDQRNSSTGEDLVPQLHSDLAGNRKIASPLRPFQRTAGDEVQAVFDDPNSLIETALVLARQGTWHIGIGAGAVNEPLPANAREGNGQAYRNARIAVERAKRSAGHVAFEGTGKFAALIEASLQLVMGLEEDRNDSWQAIGELYEQGMTQTEIAAHLQTYQSAVSRALRQGRWQETRRMVQELKTLLAEENA